jgi:hypothetical protein
MSIVLNGTTGITTPTYGGSVTAEYIAPVTAFKNRIINGAMQIDQRNAGASVTYTTIQKFIADRFSVEKSNLSTLVATAQVVSDAPSGFINSLKTTITTAESSGASSNFVGADQRIEGYNFVDFNFGTASASSFTLSFWVKSSVTGTYPVSFFNAGVNRAYLATYTISLANTWEYKTITVAGDTTGTWNTTNGIGLGFQFGLGGGTNNDGTAGSWSGTYKQRTSSCVNLNATLNATWQITGVQLEKGTTATSFDYRPYGTELALCQRYYQIIGDDTTDCVGYATYSNTTALSMYTTMTYLTMRAAPTATVATFITANTGQPTVQAGTSSLSFSLVATSANLRVAARSGTNAKPIQLSAEL